MISIQKRIGYKVRLIDSSIETAKTLRRYIQMASIQRSKTVQHRIFLSDVTDSVRQAASSIFNHSVELASP